MNSVESLVEELYFSDTISLGNCSTRTVQRWAKKINEYLEDNDYDWRVKANTKNNTIEVVE